MNIVLTGSLGHIVHPLTEILTQQGHGVTVIGRNPEKGGAVESLGATPAIGSLTDVDFITGLFRNADAAYCMVPPNYKHPDQMAYYKQMGHVYRQSILNSGIKRIVYLSSSGAHLPFGTGLSGDLTWENKLGIREQ